MHISEVRVSGVHGFHSAHRPLDISLVRDDGSVPHWVVVAGRNGAGKSTLLRSIALAISGPSVGRVLSESFSGWITDGLDAASVAVRLRFSATDSFSAGRVPTFDPWVALRWTRAEGGSEPTVDRQIVGSNWSPVRGPWAENPRGWLLAGYGPFRRLSTAPTEAQRLMMIPGRTASLASLFREEASLSEAVQWLQQIYLRKLEKKEDAAELERAVLGLLNDGLLPEGLEVTRVDSDGLWVSNADGSALTLKALSDGYRTVSALVLDIVKQISDVFSGLSTVESNGHIQITNEGVVLIDEIDVHLHVSWQQRIGFWLKSHFPNIQFVVTTHSPFICQAVDPGGLIRLPAPGEFAPATVVEGEVFSRVVNGSADDAILTDLFGLERSHSERSAQMRRELARLETSTSDAVSTSGVMKEQERIVELRRALPSTVTDQVTRAVEQLVLELQYAEDQ